MLSTALVTGSASILLSDICVKGVDTQINSVIENLPLNRCSSDLLTRYVFCQNNNMSCNPIGDANNNIFKAIEYLQDEYNKTKNETYLTALNACKSINGSLTTLSDCSISKNFYNKTTQIICGDLATSIIKTSVVMELIAILSFIFLITFCFNWHRFTIPIYCIIISDLERTKRSLDTRNSIKLSNNNNQQQRTNRYSGNLSGARTSNARLNNSRNNTTVQNTDLLDNHVSVGATYGEEVNFTLGCFFYSFIVILVWGALISGWIAVMSLGSAKVSVPRTSK